MNQTVTVNISGIVFHIEVDAYEELKKYLNKIRSYFKNSEESEEIMTDIEARIAELFNEKITSDNQVISSKDVEEVVTVMGKPEQYVDEDEEQYENSSSSNHQRTYSSAKKLFRDPDDRMIGGVASGIASYFGVDAIWLRLMFVIALFFGFGFLLYIILWIVMPEAKTASDKLQMRGDEVNIDNIGKTFKEEADKVSENLKRNGQQYGKKAENAFEAFFSFLLQVFKGVFKVLGKVFGVVFLVFGLFFCTLLILGIFDDNFIFSITQNGISAIDSKELLSLIFTSPELYVIFITSAIIMIGLPFIGLCYAGIKLLFNFKGNGAITLSLIIIWVVSIFSTFTVGVKTASDQKSKGKITETKYLSNLYGTYFLKLNEENMPGDIMLDIDDFSLSLDDKLLYSNQVELTIEKSKTDSFELTIINQSHGNSKKAAIQNAKSINYQYEISDSTILLNSYLSTLKNLKLRSQNIKMILQLPIGKIVYLDPNLSPVIFDIDNFSNTWDDDMLGKKWVMLEDGLTCLDCDEIDGVTLTELDSIRVYEPIIE
jgi:phage shock protein PspC (stress-responsive transcriptional regulator)